MRLKFFATILCVGGILLKSLAAPASGDVMDLWTDGGTRQWVNRGTTHDINILGQHNWMRMNRCPIQCRLTIGNYIRDYAMRQMYNGIVTFSIDIPSNSPSSNGNLHFIATMPGCGCRKDFDVPLVIP